MLNRTLFVLVVSASLAPASSSIVGSELTAEGARDALLRAVDYFRGEVSIEGGYLWRYAIDFSECEGETPASTTTAWVQPPGTPTVGMAFLTAYHLTGEAKCLEAAKESALALVKGPLLSGGWDYRIEFATKDRQTYAYRADDVESPASRRNVTTLDDNTTQAALSFLIRVDHALEFENERIHEAARFALRCLLAAQYPNGAWPQRFSGPPDPEKYPVVEANYPESWSRDYQGKDYRDYYTLNDNTMADMIELMFLAAEVYDEHDYADAGRRGGEFLLLAQMPEPQPGWAQQYNRDMQLARFYELKTNRPLYFTTKYRLTYSDAELPTHYGFKASSRLDELEAKYERLVALSDEESPRSKSFELPEPPLVSRKLAVRAAQVIESLDEQGAWIEPASRRAGSKIPAGAPSLSCRTFVKNVEILAQFIGATSANAASN